MPSTITFPWQTRSCLRLPTFSPAPMLRLEELAEELLGPPNKETRRRQEWRWGGKGSASLVVRDGAGKRRGAFWSHEAADGGSPLDLIRHARGCDIAAAIQWAKHWLGADRLGPMHQPANDAVLSQRVLDRAGREQVDAQAARERIACAHRLWTGTAPLAGTLAERYLVESRLIPAPPLGWPDSVRFHPPSQSLIVRLKTCAGELRAVQRIHLAPDARKIDPEEQARRHLDTAKITNGVTADAVVRLPARTLDACSDAPILLAEGPETGLREQLSRSVEQFFATAADWMNAGMRQAPPPVHAIKVDVGAGKSRIACQNAIAMLGRMRAANDQRSIVFAAPTHDLADELAKILNDTVRAQGLTLEVRAWRGMTATDPGHPDAGDPCIPRESKTQMCRNPEAVQDACAAGGTSTFKSACQRTLDDGSRMSCPSLDVCGYQRQRVTHADCWIVSHELLFLPRPAAIGKPAALVVDEACRVSGLEGIEDPLVAIPLRTLRKPASVTSASNGAISCSCTNRLHFLRSALANLLDHHPDGPVRRDQLIQQGLTVQSAIEGRRLEQRRITDPKLHPGMTVEERKTAVAASCNPETLLLVRLWQAIAALLKVDGPALSGWLSLGWESNNDQSPMRVLHLKRRREIKESWRAPTLLLDATLNLDLVRFYWPDVALTAELRAEAPHQHIRQVVDRAYSKSMLDPIDWATAATDPLLKQQIDDDANLPERRRRNLRYLHAIVCRESRRHAPARVLVVCQKRIEKALGSVGPLPANVELAHHNAVAGRDAWGPQPDKAGIRCLIVVGRTMPPVDAVRQRAEALSGRAIANSPRRFMLGDAVRERLDGELEAAEAQHHPDPIAEAIRWQICEGELLQIIGRGRGVNRTADNPLDVLVMTDIPLPLVVADTLAFVELDPCADDRMAAIGGVVLQNARHAASAYPDLWPTHEAARKALQRRSGTFLNKYVSSRDGCPTPQPDGILGQRVQYQLAGAGQKIAEAWFDPRVVEGIECWLQERLGQLAWCRMDEAPDLAAVTRPRSCREAPASEGPRLPAASPSEAWQLTATGVSSNSASLANVIPWMRPPVWMGGGAKETGDVPERPANPAAANLSQGGDQDRMQAALPHLQPDVAAWAPPDAAG